jgi:hypothetical protein
MPMTSRLLYYDLGMNADDDGYAERFTTIRMTGATEQDLQVLQANGFVKVFDENVLIIKDWKENNYIMKDRYTPSKYLNVYSLDTECIQKDNILDTQVRLGKDSIGKDSPIDTGSENPKPKKPKKTVPPKKEFIPPTLEQVVSYFTEQGYIASAGVKAWKYYDVADWTDSKGNKIINWKQKMQGVWFKDENKDNSKSR